MKPTTKPVLGLLALMVFLGTPFPLNAAEINKSLPRFFAFDMNGNMLTLPRAYLGKPLLLSFFSRTCEPCRKEIRELAALEKRYRTVKFVIIDTEDDDPKVIQRFLGRLGLHPGTVLHIYGSMETKRLFQIDTKGWPNTVVVDSKGIVRHVIIGENFPLVKSAVQSIRNW